MISHPPTALLEELLEPVGRCLTPEVAERLVRLRVSPNLDARIQELGQKCNDGLLSAQEQLEYETIARFIKFISVLQSKARLLLNDSAGD